MKKKALVLMGMFMLSAFFGSPTVLRLDTPSSAVDTVLIYGTIGLVDDLDPHSAWDSASIDHIHQVAEGLFAYNLESSDVEIIPRLAASCGEWNENATELTVPLRSDVTFHDGTPFNASAVKWNFDRLSAFIEAGESQIAELYEPLAGAYPDTPLVINRTEVIAEFTVRFVLNYPFVALLPLLCFSGSVIISPSSVANSSEFLDIDTDLLVGTGPYVHMNSTTEKTVFQAYANYYRGTPAVQHMEWVEYEDTTTVSAALLSGDMDLGDISTDFLDEFEASPNITVGQQMKGVVILYMGMNNKLINKTMRQAISYAIDYDYAGDELQYGDVVRMISPVPEGIAYHNPSVQPATYNVTKARQILIDAGLSKGLTADSVDQDWIDLAAFDPVAAYNYSLIYGSVPRFADTFGDLVITNCQAIGIKVTLAELTWSEYLDRLLGDFDKLALYFIGWGPDYNDPSVYLNPLFSNTSMSNAAQVNDPWLQNAMVEALEDINPGSRKDRYFAIQEYIVEDLMPWVFLHVGLSRDVVSNTITNWNSNPMGQLDFFSITFHGEDAEIEDPQLGISCGFEAPWEYYIPEEDPTTEPTTEPTTSDTDGTNSSKLYFPGNLGYSFFALMGMVALTILTVVFKRWKNAL